LSFLAIVFATPAEDIIVLVNGNVVEVERPIEGVYSESHGGLMVLLNGRDKVVLRWLHD
jgi:hypothetical protein